jgi:hypothetical protein
MYARDLPKTDEDVGNDEDDERGDHEGHFTMDMRRNSSASLRESLCGSSPYLVE